MSAGRHWIKELYVGFLLLLLSFLYLSHLNSELKKAEADAAVTKLKHAANAIATVPAKRDFRFL